VSGTPDFQPALRDAILDWYVSRARSLPFRGSTDPYAILVSEAMSQQTQAARAGDAWTRFMERFPTVGALAAATPADVLRAWQGLGYNRRALNLWRAARRIVDEFGGRVPTDLADLQTLPGVGPYTARAVAALAFGTPVGAVDTNVRRVLGRIVAGDVGILSPVEMQRLADSAVPADRAADWTHAVMDVGATLCRPQSPDCAACPARPWCGYAKRTRMPGTQPAVRPKAARERAAPFPTTSRWLRGRILDRLRDARDGEWVVFDSSIGAHDAESVQHAVTALATEGLVERDVGQSFVVRARLPLA
jgi:A/G-specific adenine glycosylase